MFFSSELVYSGASDIHFGHWCPWVFVAGTDVGCRRVDWFWGESYSFRFAGFHVLVQCPICSVSLRFVNNIEYVLLVIVLCSFYILHR